MRIESHTTLSNGQIRQETRYYLSSLPPDAAQHLELSRAHWAIENSCHWVLDVIFDEDACRVRRDHGAENMALMRRITLNLIRTDTSKGSVKLKRHRAAWNDDFLAQLLGLQLV